MTEGSQGHRCTLTRVEAEDRRETDRALARRVIATERLERGLRVVFTGGADGRELVDTFVRNESACCGFFGFAVEERDGSVVLEVTAPAAEDAQQLLDAAQQAFDRGPETVTWHPSSEVGRG